VVSVSTRIWLLAPPLPQGVRPWHNIPTPSTCALPAGGTPACQANRMEGFRPSRSGSSGRHKPRKTRNLRPMESTNVTLQESERCVILLLCDGVHHGETATNRVGPTKVCSRSMSLPWRLGVVHSRLSPFPSTKSSPDQVVVRALENPGSFRRASIPSAQMGFDTMASVHRGTTAI
jgi:hypothetical protein